MENATEQLKKLTNLKIPILTQLHKTYCLSLHPLWTQILSQLWKFLPKYWKSDTIQVVSLSNLQVFKSKIKESLSNPNSEPLISEISEGLLLTLAEYYGVNFHKDEQCADQNYFSLSLIFEFLQYKSINIYNLLYSSLSTLILFKKDLLSMPSDFFNFSPTVKVKII